MRLIALLVLLGIYPFVHADIAKNHPISGEGDNGLWTVISAIGTSADERSITGYHRVLNLSMPGRGFNADCIVVFMGNLSNKNSIDIRAKNVDFPSSRPVTGTLFFDGINYYGPSARQEQLYRLKLNQNIPGCSGDVDLAQNELQFNINIPGTWEKVSAIKAKRAYFYAEPNESKVTKTYLVTGDLIYIYKQGSDWYYVKFQGPKKETTGWIRKSDTLDFDLQ